MDIGDAAVTGHRSKSDRKGARRRRRRQQQQQQRSGLPGRCSDAAMNPVNATSLYVSTCRYIMQCEPQDPGSFPELYKLLPYLRQSLSCCVCGECSTMQKKYRQKIATARAFLFLLKEQRGEARSVQFYSEHCAFSVISPPISIELYKEGVVHCTRCLHCLPLTTAEFNYLISWRCRWCKFSSKCVRVFVLTLVECKWRRFPPPPQRSYSYIAFTVQPPFAVYAFFV